MGSAVGRNQHTSSVELTFEVDKLKSECHIRHMNTTVVSVSFET